MTSFSTEKNQVLSMTKVVLTLANELFECKGKKFKINVTQYRHRGDVMILERSVELLCGDEVVYSGKTLAYVLDHMCAVLNKSRKKLPAHLLKEVK